jgi:glycosyltransferase involved in cell wall biosynthesis
MSKWTIAILTVPERSAKYERLLNVLWPQIEHDAGIELMTNNGPGTIAEKRQWCLDNAKGEYFCFIDDDDLIAENYVDAIYPLLDGVDYIGFQLQYYHDGVPWKPTYHSLRHSTAERFADENGFYRGVSHLNPIRTEIARQGRYEGSYGEDDRWAVQVHPKSEHYINEVMYHYRFSTSNSLTYGRT